MSARFSVSHDLILQLLCLSYRHGCCRNFHVASGATSVSDLSYLAANQGLLPGGSGWGSPMAMESARHAHRAVGLQFWRSHDLDAVAVQMALTASVL